MLLRSLRIALYVQLVLGLVLFFGPTVGFTLGRGLGDLHGLIGLVIAGLALVGFRPRPAVPMTGIRIAAWVSPLLPLILGLGFWVGAFGSLGLVPIHMTLGLIVLGLVEMASAQDRRSQRRGGRISP